MNCPSVSLSSGVTVRAVLTGLLLVAIISIVSPWAILVVKGSQLTSNAIPIVAVLSLFLLTALVVPLLRLANKQLAYTHQELIAIYTMLLTGSVVVTTGFTGSFLTLVTGATYYATPENNWGSLFVANLHPWLVPTQEEAVRLFYEGLPRGMSIPWEAWIVPLASWTGFILIFYVVIFCTAVLLRGQWVENERLVYPLTKLPLAMIENVEESRTGFLFKNRLMWFAFVIPLMLHSWNSLNYYHDAFQPIALTGAVGLLGGQVDFPFRLNLPVLGLAYFMALNVSFSVWFFFLAGVAQHLVFTRLGLPIGAGDVWNSGSAPPAIMHEQAGALLVLSFFVMWTARKHLEKFWYRLETRHRGQTAEVITPRQAFGGALAGLVSMIAWLSVTGLDLYVALLLTVGALIVFIGLSRIVCEAGLPGCQTPMVPQAFITRGFGPGVLGLQNMTGLGLSTVWMGETAANMMNAVVHSLKLTTSSGRQDGRIPVAVFLAIIVGLAGSIWFTMTLAYRFGGVNLHSWYFVGAPKWPFTYMASVANQPEGSFLPRLYFTAGGGLFMGALLLMRQRFVWWPLHPIGFPISTTYTIVYYDWFSIFLAWVFKGVILRYGGVRLYRSLQPFFLGLVLGEFTTAAAWVFIDGYYGVEGNMIFNF